MGSHQEQRRQAQYPPIKKQDGSWARSEEEKADTFRFTHLSKVFKPNPRELTEEENRGENKLFSDDKISIILEPHH
jgi:hypothetical protein